MKTTANPAIGDAETDAPWSGSGASPLPGPSSVTTSGTCRSPMPSDDQELLAEFQRIAEPLAQHLGDTADDDLLPPGRPSR